MDSIGSSKRKYKGRGGRPVSLDLSNALTDAPDGLYYTKMLDDSLREAGYNADVVNTPIDYTQMMRSLAADMDMINSPRSFKLKPQYKTLDPWGKMQDDVPAQFASGGAVQPRQEGRVSVEQLNAIISALEGQL
jgi:hypothetical protein